MKTGEKHMKKEYLMILMLVIAWSMPALEGSASFEIGIERITETTAENGPTLNIDWYYYTTLEFETYVLTWVRVYGLVKTDFIASEESIYYIPFHAEYEIGIDIYLGDYVTFGIWHRCEHPVVVGSSWYGNDLSYLYDRGAEKVSIKIHF
jgi:hypothetical protein